jgi:hypothetical protein
MTRPKAGWLPDMDLNHDKQIQSLLCYRYTIGQTRLSKGKRFGVRVKPAEFLKWHQNIASS